MSGEIEIVFLQREGCSESCNITYANLKPDKIPQSYRGIAVGNPGNTPKHIVEYEYEYEGPNVEMGEADTSSYVVPEAVEEDETLFEEEGESETLNSEDLDWIMEYDSDLCECGSECETIVPIRCNSALFQT